MIEYQFRGLPHFHMVLKLKDIDLDITNVESTSAFINEYVKAELPKREDFKHLSERTFKKYYQLVSCHMVHNCAVAINGCKKNKEDSCKRKYDRVDYVPITTIDDKGYVQYRRRTPADLRIVPHHVEMLLDWDGHLNVEFSATVVYILYMFKYLYKGVKRQKINITSENGDTTSEYENEVSLFLKGQILCSMDAYFRILGFHT